YAIRKSQSKVLLFGIIQCFRQLQVIFHTVWPRRVKILIFSPPIGDHWCGSNSRRRVLLGPWRETASCATEAALPRVHIRPPERRRNFEKFSIPTRRFASAKEMFGGKCD
ncbi:unnamed protein product, partial [Nesidiocoris tenuis]